MYVKIENNTPVEWPVQAFQIRSAFSHVSFPSPMVNEDVLQFGFEPYKTSDKPIADELIESVEEVAPVKQADGSWLQQWQVVEKYSAEERDRLLAEREVEREGQQRTGLVQQIADRRWRAEVAGIDIGGMRIDTGRDSQALITGATVQAMLDPSYALRWKTPDGFVDLTAEQIIGVATAARAHVQACFNREAELLDALEAGTFTPEMLEQGWPA